MLQKPDIFTCYRHGNVDPLSMCSCRVGRLNTRQCEAIDPIYAELFEWQRLQQLYLSLSAALARPAAAQASSLSLPGAPPTPMAPIVSFPTLTCKPPPTMHVTGMMRPADILAMAFSISLEGRL